MKFALWPIAAALACVPAAASSAIVQFSAPAANVPTQHLRAAVFDAVLPSGRIVTPFGENVVTGVNALGVALTPDGRFAIVSNDDDRASRAQSAVDPQVFGGYSLAVVDTATMRVVDRFGVPGETYFAGVSAVTDPRFPARTLIFAAGGAGNNVYVLDLDAMGHLIPDVQHAIALERRPDAVLGGPASAGPGTLVASHDGRRLYVINAGGDSVTAIDTLTRSVVGTSRAVGFAPFGAALAGERLLVTSEGLTPFARARVALPATAPASYDASSASSLASIPLEQNGDLAAPTAPNLALDIAPDGARVVGGAHPTSIAVTAAGTYAFIAMTNVDRIATVALGTAPVVVGGTELRLFDRGPYGTQPAALALSGDGTRLYVALAGLNAVAVLDARDPIHLHRLGLIPTGWFPSAMALSADDRTLYVANTKGFGHDAAIAGGDPASPSAAVWSTLQKIDLGTVRLSDTTVTTLKNTRATQGPQAAYPSALRNVVTIVEPRQTFDAVLGDLGYGPADPRFIRFGESVTPNLHALARRFAVAGNLYADAQTPAAARQFLAGGVATVFTQRTLRASGSDSRADSVSGRSDIPRGGFLSDNLARHHVSFREYGDVSGSTSDPSSVDDPKSDEPDTMNAAAAAPADLAGGDERRARAFIRDYAALVSAHRQPRYAQMWLSGDRVGSVPDLAPMSEHVADADRALGAIVQNVSRLPTWKNTVIFVLPADAGDARDHVDDDRLYAVVISPFARRHYIGMHHLSTASALKTTEQILHVPPLALGDLLATDMRDFFTTESDARPITAVELPAFRQTAAPSGANRR